MVKRLARQRYYALRANYGIKRGLRYKGRPHTFIYLSFRGVSVYQGPHGLFVSLGDGLDARDKLSLSSPSAILGIWWCYSGGMAWTRGIISYLLSDVYIYGRLV